MSSGPVEHGGRRVPLRFAAVAAVVAVAGGGLFVLGRVSVPQPAAPSAPVASPTVVESPQASAIPAVGVESTQPSIPTVFTPADGLPDEVGFARGYRLDDSGIDRVELAGFLAATFGVIGAPAQQDDGSVVVEQADGARLVVGGDVLVPWEFTAAPGRPVGQAMAGDQAQRVVAELLAQLGVDTDEVDWQVADGRRTVTVTAWQTLDGRRTDLSWTVTLGPRATVLAATGFAGTLQQTPDYPVVGAATAVTRSQLPGWSAFGPSPLSPADAEPEPEVTATAVARLGRPIIVGSVRTLEVTGAELELAQHRQPDGTLLIVPAYVLTTDDGARWTLLAVRDGFVEMRPPLPSASASPTAEPTP